MNDLFDTVKDILEQTLFPETLGNWFLSVTAVSIVLLIIYFTIRKSLPKFTWLLSIRFVCSVFLHYTLVFWIIPGSQRFNEDEIGIIICQFSGASLSHNTGNEGIEERINQQLKAELEKLQINKLVSVKTVSRKVDSRELALSLIDRYEAKGIMWGIVTELEGAANLLYKVNWQDFRFGFRGYGNNKYDEEFDYAITHNSEYTVSFTPEEFSLDSVVNPILNDMMPFVTYHIQPTNPRKLLRILDSVPIGGAWQAGNMITAAQVSISMGDTVDALNRYRKAVDLACNSLMNPLLKVIDDPDYYPRMLQKIAATSKFQEGIVSSQMGDTINTVSAFLLAGEIDPILKEDSRIKIHEFIGNEFYTIPGKSMLPECFSQTR